MKSKRQRSTGIPARSRARDGIAVAIACYNQGRFLERCVTSVLEQTRTPQEIILVDDGSTDDTREIAWRFDGVHYVFQENSGLSAARNSGLRLATQRRILFLDADDWLTPIALEAAGAAFERASPSPAFVHGSYNEVGEDERLLSTHSAQEHSDPFLQLLSGNFVAMHGTVLYDAELLRASGGFDCNLQSCEDYDVLLRLARDHPVAAYPEVAANYRRHPLSLSRDRFAMIATALSVIDRHFQATARTQLFATAARQGRRFMTRYYVRRMKSDLRQSRSVGELPRAIAEIALSAVRKPRALGQVLSLSLERTARAPKRTG